MRGSRIAREIEEEERAKQRALLKRGIKIGSDSNGSRETDFIQERILRQYNKFL